MKTTRREFLHTGCGALSAMALMSSLGRFALIDALAQSGDAGSYRALVCVFLFGGNDANNIVIPYDNYADYAAWRPVGHPINIPQSALLQITPPSAGATFGLHPRLGDSFTGTDGVRHPSLYDLWNRTPSSAGIVCNMGPLIRPFRDRAEYRTGVARPYQLFSHSDQQNLWQTSFATGPRQTGWGGRTADLVVGGDGRFPVISSIAGVTVFSTGLNTRPLVLSPAPTALNASLRLLRTQDQDALRAALTADGDGTMPALIRGAVQVTQNALGASDLLSTDPTLNTLFPNFSLGNQLRQVAKLMKIAPSLGLTRQIYFTSIGGFDTHNSQGGMMNGQQANLWSQLSQAIGSFYDATVELGLSNQVTTFTMSDFSRTFNPNETGTDHAWGSHQFIVGDAIQGGNFYGTYPPLIVGDGTGSLDTDAGSGARGRWIPTTSVDQFGATLADWYGLAASDRTVVFPNIGNFTPQLIPLFRPS